jgi:hypothetical protein
MAGRGDGDSVARRPAAYGVIVSATGIGMMRATCTQAYPGSSIGPDMRALGTAAMRLPRLCRDRSGKGLTRTASVTVEIDSCQSNGRYFEGEETGRRTASTSRLRRPQRPGCDTLLAVPPGVRHGHGRAHRFRPGNRGERPAASSSDMCRRRRGDCGSRTHHAM